MLLAHVVGTVVSTVKDERLQGVPLLVLRPATGAAPTEAATFVAVDSVGAGRGDLVLVAQGSAARETVATRSVPTDATIVAILDRNEVDTDG